MKTAILSPSERLRPHMGQPRIDYANGSYVVRSAATRMDPNVSAGERRFSNVFEVVLSWAAFLGICAFGWWALIEGTKLVYSFAFSHPFFH